MNPRIDRLHAYPFERLRALLDGAIPPSSLPHIPLSIGEPRHAPPPFVAASLTAALDTLGAYPAALGLAELREAAARWLERRFGLMPGSVDAGRMVLPVNGTREGLFSFVQAIVDDSRPRPAVLMPNPFYQIYEGAALLAGAEPVYLDCIASNGWLPDLDAVPAADWERCQVLFLCSPGNPTGAVMPGSYLRRAIELADRHDFVIAADECYSEIYLGDIAPLGSLEAAAALGRCDFRNLVAFTSLSKRSNVPGLRSGFVAGDARLLKAFLLYRTYHGSAMSPPVQRASIAAWGDEAHVAANRALYRRKFGEVTPILAEVLDVALPDAGFYLWAGVPDGDDVAFALDLLAQYNVAVLPGSLLARKAHGINPGAGRIRLALVADADECLEAAKRIVACVNSLRTVP